jgi:hypothetical protein
MYSTLSEVRHLGVDPVRNDLENNAFFHYTLE